ncbi:N-acetylglucosamine-6-phosphate deacetylase [Olivibacter sp. XZL3]|uniref:N-acetylglucosamine-6-phosphate deacetylase n=1 Tax=Olivibacter sp. XZL3 TaxID=1735116 RepID=UPI0010667523|nr:N-acetylglucosamine-6-phosphate deacetylase [Olivibacter sp. XZL3]
MDRIKIINGHVIGPHRILPQGVVVIEGDKIVAVSAHDVEVGHASVIDAKGAYIAPGFIDIHVHGGGGADFMDGKVEAFLQIAKTHAQYGTTAMVPTTLTSTQDQLIRTLDCYEEALKQNHKGAQFLGMHLEGPYFAMSQRGAQDPRYIRDPDPKEYHEILKRADLIARWSAAPEREGALDFGRTLREKGVLAAIAHTDAVYDEVLQAVDAGYTLATHLYSGMSGVSRRNALRYAGVIESALLLDEIDVEIIADGVHLPEGLLKLIYKVKGPEKIALITDAMRAAGTEEQTSVLGGEDQGIAVIIEDDVAKLPDRSSLAGSIATADRLLRVMLSKGGAPLCEAIRMLSATPARIMGVSARKGSLVSGKDADIVFLDKDFKVVRTIIMGRTVWTSD